LADALIDELLFRSSSEIPGRKIEVSELESLDDPGPMNDDQPLQEDPATNRLPNHLQEEEMVQTAQSPPPPPPSQDAETTENIPQVPTAASDEHPKTFFRMCKLVILDNYFK
jgi:hypothetical protein